MLAETIVDSLVTLLTTYLPESLDIKSYAISESQIRQVQDYPMVFVLCPTYDVLEWQSDGYIDVKYNTLLGAIVIDQTPETLRRKLYQITEEILRALIKSQNLGIDEFGYTMMKRDVFVTNFGPIFTDPTSQQFMADAQITVSFRQTVVEQLNIS